jgi:hypothetical protein
MLTKCNKRLYKQLQQRYVNVAFFRIVGMVEKIKRKHGTFTLSIIELVQLLDELLIEEQNQ